MPPDQIAWIFGFLSGVWVAVPFGLFIAFVLVPIAIDVWAAMRRVGHRHARGR